MQQLIAIAQKTQRHIIGLMSGTSVDGLDIAYCRISGEGHNTNIELLAFETISYEPDFKAEIKSVFSKKEVDFENLWERHKEQKAEVEQLQVKFTKEFENQFSENLRIVLKTPLLINLNLVFHIKS